MNLLNIIEKLDLEKIDHEEFLKPAMRRGLFKKASDYTLKAALASIPFAMAALPKIAKAATNDANSDVLNFALTLEYLEAEFYATALQSTGLIPGSDMAVIAQISKHKTAHVAFLKSALGAAAVAKPTFDFTAGGTFADVFTKYETFLTLAQAFEDTGVRAYKGQAGNITNKTFLTYALQIHSVEARHASEIRRMRGNKGWIVLSNSETVLAPIYAGEDNLMQGGVDISKLPALAGISKESLTEAFDEPLAKDKVLEIASLFIAK